MGARQACRRNWRNASRAWMTGFGAFLIALSGLVSPRASSAASLTVADAVVVKFGASGGVRVRDRLVTEEGVRFTSLQDDELLGQTLSAPGQPAAGDWLGLRVDPSVPPQQLQIGRLRIRYAGGQGQAALDLARRNYDVDYLEIADSDVAIRVGDGAQPLIAGATLTGNRIGLEAVRGAQPTLTLSDLSANTEFGAVNRTPALSVVVATGNWWGAQDGPGPTGQGSQVSPGVQVDGDWLAHRPLIDCRVAPANGLFVSVRREVLLDVRCRNATAVRFRQQLPFPQTFQPLPADQVAAYSLTSEPGVPVVVEAEYVDAYPETGAQVVVQTSQPMVFQPGVPVIAFVSPPPGQVVLPGTQALDLLVTADDSDGVDRVEFRLGSASGSLIGIATGSPFQTVWQLGTLADGDYTVFARVFNVHNQHATAQVGIQLRRFPPDTSGPAIENVRLAGAVLTAGEVNTIAAGGLLTFGVQDPSGVASVVVQLDGVTVPGGTAGGTFSAPLLLAQPDGSYDLSISAVDTLGNATLREYTLHLVRPPLSAPTIVSPPGNAIVNQPNVLVSGTAMPGATVTLTVDGATVGDGIPVSASGTFTRNLALPAGQAQQVFQLRASAALAGQTSESAVVPVQFLALPPTVSLDAPAANAVFDDNVPVTVSAFDTLGLPSVVALVNDTDQWPFSGTSPYEILLPVSAYPEGELSLRIVATNLFGLSSEASRTVRIERPTAPPPLVTPYQGQIDQIVPALTHGVAPIQIQGRATKVVDGQTIDVPNSLLTLALQVDGFERRISVTTNENGVFTFQFRPQPADAGVYRVAARHPDAPSTPLPGSAPGFTVDRLVVRDANALVRAAFDVPIQVPVHVTAAPGVAVNDLRVYLHPNDGKPGVEVTPFDLPSLAGGAAATLLPEFRGDPTAVSGESIVLSLVQNPGPGELVRARIPLQYFLAEAAPLLWATPTSLRLGVVHGQQVVDSIKVENRGPAAATGFQAQLVKVDGQPVWPWLRLVSPAVQGDLQPGERRTFDIAGTPGSHVPPGRYDFRVRLTAANAQTHLYPASIRVAEAGEGAVRFHVQDIFTDPDGLFGPPSYGLAGARVRLQHEDDSALTAQGSTDQNGVLVLNGLQPGRYTYRASAPNRDTADGRVWVRPGTNEEGFEMEESVFLDYAAVSFEWSITETYVPDRYDVTISAIFQTLVPAPVVVISPGAINLPDMQVGEELTGTLTITNHGLIAAEEVVFTPPADDPYFEIRFLGQVPSVLPAGQSVTLPYRVRSLSPLPELNLPAQPQRRLLKLAELLEVPLAKAGGQCSSYSANIGLRYSFRCANGDQRAGTGNSRYTKMYGSTCGTTSPRPSWVPGQPIGTGHWGEPGGIGGPLGGYPMGPPCTPTCSSCACLPGGSGGGGPPGGGGGPPGGGGPSSGPPGGGGGSPPPPVGSR